MPPISFSNFDHRPGRYRSAEAPLHDQASPFKPACAERA